MLQQQALSPRVSARPTSAITPTNPNHTGSHRANPPTGRTLGEPNKGRIWVRESRPVLFSPLLTTVCLGFLIDSRVPEMLMGQPRGGKCGGAEAIDCQGLVQLHSNLEPFRGEMALLSSSVWLCSCLALFLFCY